MSVTPEENDRPSRARIITAAIAVLLLVIGVWMLIEYRTQPPSPPNPPPAGSP